MPASDIAGRIAAWMADRANNALFPGADLPAFDTPLVGFANGADPLFARIKEDIGADFYWTPHEAFALAFAGDVPPAGELTVIAWILPQTAATRAAHKACRDLPDIAWSRARHFGEKVNENLRRFVVGELAGEGIRAVAPTLLPAWDRHISPRFGFASNWSERHAAHVCGLGTFGLSDGLITARGKAVRVGSVVAHTVLPPTPRTYATHNAWCLAASGRVCRACAKRCPAGAIGPEGHDKVKCKDYIRGVTAPYVEENQLGFRVNSCGLCQVGVPCEARNPTAKREAKDSPAA